MRKKLGKSGSQRASDDPPRGHNKTTLDTAKPACLLSDRQPAAVYSLPLLKPRIQILAQAHPFLSFCRAVALGVIICVLNAASCSHVLAVHIPDRRLKPRSGTHNPRSFLWASNALSVRKSCFFQVESTFFLSSFVRGIFTMLPIAGYAN